MVSTGMPTWMARPPRVTWLAAVPLSPCRSLSLSAVGKGGEQRRQCLPLSEVWAAPQRGGRTSLCALWPLARPAFNTAFGGGVSAFSFD